MNSDDDDSADGAGGGAGTDMNSILPPDGVASRASYVGQLDGKNVVKVAIGEFHGAALTANVRRILPLFLSIFLIYGSRLLLSHLCFLGRSLHLGSV